MADQNTTHTADAIGRLPEQHKGKAGFENFLTALTAPVQEIEDAFWELFTERQIDTAVGQQLDDLGAIVGEPRAGLSDDVYRRYVRARIRANKSRGTVADVLRVLSGVISDDDATLTVRQEPPASFSVIIGGVPLTDETAGVAADFLRDSAAAGVRALLEYGEAPIGERFKFADVP